MKTIQFIDAQTSSNHWIFVYPGVHAHVIPLISSARHVQKFVEGPTTPSPMHMQMLRHPAIYLAANGKMLNTVLPLRTIEWASLLVPLPLPLLLLESPLRAPSITDRAGISRLNARSGLLPQHFHGEQDFVHTMAGQSLEFPSIRPSAQMHGGRTDGDAVKDLGHTTLPTNLGLQLNRRMCRAPKFYTEVRASFRQVMQETFR